MKNIILLGILLLKKNKHPRILRTMKTTVFLLILFTGIAFAENTKSQNAHVNINKQQTALKYVLEEIEQQTDYLFISNRDINLEQEVSIKAKDLPVKDVLNRLFSNTELGYAMEGVNIILYTKGTTGRQELITKNGRTVTGRVTDERGDALIGASVVVKGTTNGVITDTDGNFSISIPDGATLQITYIGYIGQDIVVNSQTVFNVKLVEDVQGIEDIVVIGYGVVKKKDLTGAVMQVRSDDLLKSNSTTLASALQGQIPADIGGVWKPGSNPTIEIRGISSITGSNNPLWVVDGIPMQSSSVNINPNDIESVDILKDASASAIYGARGSNGVIIVTTKRAVVGESKIKASYSGWVGFDKLSGKPDLMSADDFVDYKRTAKKNAGQDYSDAAIFDAVEAESWKNRNFTDWYDLVWGGTSFSTNHNFTLNASSKQTATMLSLSYLDQGSLIETAGFKRYNINFNNTFQPSDRLKFTTAILGSYSKTDDFHAYVRHAYYLTPLGTPYDEDGKLKLYANPNEALITNPLAEIENNKNATEQYGFIGSISMDWKIWDELSYKFSAGIDFTTDDNGRYEGSQTRDRSQGAHAASYESRKRLSSIVDNVLNYNKSINGIHKIGVMGGFNIETYKTKSVYLRGTDMFFDGLYYNLESAATVLEKNTKLSEWGIMSLMARANYSLLDRYLLTFTYRRDGSSRLSDENKWAGFPSVSVAWRISEEAFMRNFNEKFLDNLKLRLSWGNTGNTNADPYGTLGRLSTTYYSWNEAPAMGTIPSGIPNPSLKWEKTEEYNIGLDFGLFNSRLNGAIDFYNRKTKDLILSRNLPATSGYTSITQNIGSTRNRGVEVTLNGDVVRNNKFSWNVGLSFFKNKNEILDLFGDKKDDIGSSRFIGHPIRVNYLLDFIGVWQESEAEQAAVYGAKPGYPKYRDIYNKDGEKQSININDDRYIISKEPSWIGGINTTLAYKGFDLYLSLNTRQGEKEWSDVHRVSEDDPVRYAGFKGDFWTPENRSNSNPAPAVVGTYPDLRNSDYFVKDVSFIRLSNVSLGYTLPKKIVNKFSVQNAKVYVNVSNPYVWTKYKGQDPQVIDREKYPAVTSYQLGVNLNF